MSTRTKQQPTLPVRLLLAMGALAFVQGCRTGAGTSHAAPHWSYAGADGPAAWARLAPEFAVCGAGKQQSPVDIMQPVEAALPAIEFHYQAAPATIINNGHTVQANFSAGNWISVGGERYELQQLHFHHPSEHLIQGRPADLEMHLVHKSTGGAFAVVGVMIDRGSAQDQAFAPALDTLPSTQSEQRHLTLNPRDLLPGGSSYFMYPGSLTTPPCSEGIRWLLLANPMHATPAEIEGFARLYPLNARPVQPLEGRQVKRSPPGT